MLVDWHIGNNVCSITAIDTKECDKIVDEINKWFSYQNLISLCGKLLHVQSFAHILNLLFEDALQEAKIILCKIMSRISYVWKTLKHNENFRWAVAHVRSKGKKVTSEDMPIS